MIPGIDASKIVAWGTPFHATVMVLTGGLRGAGDTRWPLLVTFSGLVGGLGLAPGLNAGERHAMAQATHGSAPDIAGRNLANPYAMIMSGKMLFDWLGMKKNEPLALEAGRLVECAVERVIAEGRKLTPDLGGSARTAEMGDAVAAAISAA